MSVDNDQTKQTFPRRKTTPRGILQRALSNRALYAGDVVKSRMCAVMLFPFPSFLTRTPNDRPDIVGHQRGRTIAPFQ